MRGDIIELCSVLMRGREGQLPSLLSVTRDTGREPLELCQGSFRGDMREGFCTHGVGGHGMVTVAG